MVYIGNNITLQYDCYVNHDWFMKKKQFLADTTFVKSTWLRYNLINRNNNVVIPPNLLKFSDKPLKIYDIQSLIDKGLVSYEKFKENSFSSKKIEKGQHAGK